MWCGLCSACLSCMPSPLHILRCVSDLYLSLLGSLVLLVFFGFIFPSLVCRLLYPSIMYCFTFSTFFLVSFSRRVNYIHIHLSMLPLHCMQFLSNQLRSLQQPISVAITLCQLSSSLVYSIPFRSYFMMFLCHHPMNLKLNAKHHCISSRL